MPPRPLPERPPRHDLHVVVPRVREAQVGLLDRGPRDHDAVVGAEPRRRHGQRPAPRRAQVADAAPQRRVRGDAADQRERRPVDAGDVARDRVERQRQAVFDVADRDLRGGVAAAVEAA